MLSLLAPTPHRTDEMHTVTYCTAHTHVRVHTHSHTTHTHTTHTYHTYHTPHTHTRTYTHTPRMHTHTHTHTHTYHLEGVVSTSSNKVLSDATLQILTNLHRTRTAEEPRSSTTIPSQGTTGGTAARNRYACYM